jgi:methyltransferase (TIGR00027 family)
MKAGEESQTSVLVCMGRALAHGRMRVPQFSDPTALQLLPEDARWRVERAMAGLPPSSIREKIQREFLERRAAMMVARTVAIDDAVRAAATPQLVILGAGLDGRAWRMPELRDVTVFEVDHPDSQREKRQRSQALATLCRNVRFVPVDYARDSLEEALVKAGHDAGRPTTWIWEGVVMYLDQDAIEATLSVLQRRSAPASRLVVAYHSPGATMRLVGVLLKQLGEPLKSAFTQEQMAALLARYGFAVLQDEDVCEVATRLSAELAEAARVMRHLRIVTATRSGPC